MKNVEAKSCYQVGLIRKESPCPHVIFNMTLLKNQISPSIYMIFACYKSLLRSAIIYNHSNNKHDACQKSIVLCVFKPLQADKRKSLGRKMVIGRKTPKISQSRLRSDF